MSAKILMIGLDGADGVLLDRWSLDGSLPCLEALRARGAAARLSAPEGITDDALWASFQFASRLGEHGRYHYLQTLSSGNMGMAFRDEADRESFWHSLSRQGRRVAVFDIPKCGSPQPLNGIHLVDWLVHGRYFKEPVSYPEALAAEILERFGPAPPSRCGYLGSGLSDAEALEVTNNLRTGIARKRAAGLTYLAGEAWDLFLIGFKEAHCAGHMLWDLSDSAHAEFDAARTARLGDPVRTIFRELDAAVGALVAAAGPDALVAVFSTTDMVPNSTMMHLMPEIVRRMNRALGASAVSRGLRRLRGGARQRTRPPCECLPYNENCTALRINPQPGPWGSPPIDGKSALADRVTAILRELIDADTGRPVVDAIDRPSAEQGGSRSGTLPDLLIRYPAGMVPRAVVSPRLGRIEGALPPARPGNHAAGGFLVVTGSLDGDVLGVQDLGPMISRALGNAK
jgi:hypothetical protein